MSPKIEEEVRLARVKLDEFDTADQLKKPELARSFVDAIARLNELLALELESKLATRICNIKSTYIRSFVASLEELLSLNPSIEHWALICFALLDIDDDVSKVIDADPNLKSIYDRFFGDEYRDQVVRLLTALQKAK